MHGVFWDIIRIASTKFLLYLGLVAVAARYIAKFFSMRLVYIKQKPNETLCNPSAAHAISGHK